MLYEKGERKTTGLEMADRIEKINNSSSIIFGVEKNKELVGFISAQKGK